MRITGIAFLIGIILSHFVGLPQTAIAASKTHTGGAPGIALRNNKPDYNQIEAEVLRVIDGDTLKMRIHIWPGQTVISSVRIRGIDAPESDWRAKCDPEKRLGIKAKKSTQRKYKNRWVLLENVRHSGIYNRIEADVKRWRTDRFLYLKNELLTAKLGSENKDFDWCQYLGEGQ